MSTRENIAALLAQREQPPNTDYHNLVMAEVERLKNERLRGFIPAAPSGNVEDRRNDPPMYAAYDVPLPNEFGANTAKVEGHRRDQILERMKRPLTGMEHTLGYGDIPHPQMTVSQEEYADILKEQYQRQASRGRK